MNQRPRQKQTLPPEPTLQRSKPREEQEAVYRQSQEVEVLRPLHPGGWDESAGLRETYLYHFPRPEDAAALRHVIALLLELNLENPRFLEPAGAPLAVTPTRLELVAVTRDLRHCQGFLLQVAREPKLSALSPVDEALARFAGKQAEALALIAGALERALG